MARLFIGEREIQFINDLTKEFIKDVAGQAIQYFPVSATKSQVHGIYNESTEKIFENPIKIPALVGVPEYSSKTTSFGADIEAKVEVLIQYRDLQDKNLVVSEGDYFSYDDVLYEILTVTNAGKAIFGLAEYNTGWKITARNARIGTVNVPNLPAPRLAPEESQRVFEQQRGLPINSSNELTGDVREMRERLKENMAPITLGTGPRTVDPISDPDGNGDYIEDSASSFNNDPLPAKKGLYDE